MFLASTINMYSYIHIFLSLFIANSSASPIGLPSHDIVQEAPAITPAAVGIIFPRTPEYIDPINGDTNTLDPDGPVITAPAQSHLDKRDATIVISAATATKPETIYLDDNGKEKHPKTKAKEKDGNVLTISYPTSIPTKILVAPDWTPTDGGTEFTQIKATPTHKVKAPTTTKAPTTKPKVPTTTGAAFTWSQGMWEAYASWYHHMTATGDATTTKPVDPNKVLVSSPTKPFPLTKSFEDNFSGGGYLTDVELPLDKSLTNRIVHPTKEHKKTAPTTTPTPKDTTTKPTTVKPTTPKPTTPKPTTTHQTAKPTHKTETPTPPAKPAGTASPLAPPPAAKAGKPQEPAPKPTGANKGVAPPPPPANPTGPKPAPAPVAAPPGNNPNNPMGPAAYTSRPAVGAAPPPPAPPAPATTTRCTTTHPPPPPPAPAKATAAVGVAPPAPPPPPPAEPTHDEDCGCEKEIVVTTVIEALLPPVQATGNLPPPAAANTHKPKTTNTPQITQITIEAVTFTSKTLPAVVMVTPTAAPTHKNKVPATTETAFPWSQSMWEAYASWYHHLTTTHKTIHTTTRKPSPTPTPAPKDTEPDLPIRAAPVRTADGFAKILNPG